MPKVFDWNGYRFHFYSNEGDPLEPPHIHVRKGRDDAKFWLQPEVVVASMGRHCSRKPLSGRLMRIKPPGQCGGYL